MAKHVTRKRQNGKPAKPHKDFPLSPHNNGQWTMKIRGKQHSFGLWSDRDGARRRYLDQKDDLLTGRTPRAGREGLTFRELVNGYLNAKRRAVETGDLAALGNADIAELPMASVDLDKGRPELPAAENGHRSEVHALA
jgi:hypothetical protein